MVNFIEIFDIIDFKFKYIYIYGQVLNIRRQKNEKSCEYYIDLEV